VTQCNQQRGTLRIDGQVDGEGMRNGANFGGIRSVQ
jgi:hypothetical protein